MNSAHQNCLKEELNQCVTGRSVKELNQLGKTQSIFRDGAIIPSSRGSFREIVKRGGESRC